MRGCDDYTHKPSSQKTAVALAFFKAATASGDMFDVQVLDAQDARWPQDGDDDDDDAKMFYPRVQDVLHFGWIRASSGTQD